MDASEENDGYSSGEDPLNSDPEDEVGKKLVSKTFTSRTFAVSRLTPLTCRRPLTLQAPGKYTVVADCEKAGPQELSVKSGDVVQLIREGEEGQW